jgi:hypothetical protein
VEPGDVTAARPHRNEVRLHQTRRDRTPGSLTPATPLTGARVPVRFGAGTRRSRRRISAERSGGRCGSASLRLPAMRGRKVIRGSKGSVAKLHSRDPCRPECRKAPGRGSVETSRGERRGVPLNHRRPGRLARAAYLSVPRGTTLFPFMAPRYRERVSAPLSCPRVPTHSDSMTLGRPRASLFEEGR